MLLLCDEGEGEDLGHRLHRVAVRRGEGGRRARDRGEGADRAVARHQRQHDCRSESLRGQVRQIDEVVRLRGEVVDDDGFAGAHHLAEEAALEPVGHFRTRAAPALGLDYAAIRAALAGQAGR